MGHQPLVTYFKTNFALMQHHKWSLSDMDEMMPWEKQVYVDLLQDFLKQEEERLKDLEIQRKSQMQTANRRRM